MSYTTIVMTLRWWLILVELIAISEGNVKVDISFGINTSWAFIQLSIGFSDTIS